MDIFPIYFHITIPFYWLATQVVLAIFGHQAEYLHSGHKKINDSQLLRRQSYGNPCCVGIFQENLKIFAQHLNNWRRY